MKTEQLAGGRFLLEQEEGVFPLTTDTLLLADFASLHRGDRVADLGCGSGALGLLLTAREESLSYTGLDSSSAACDLTRRNLAANGLAGQALQADLCNPEELPSGKATLAVSNPPYFDPRRGAAAQGGRGRARCGCSVQQLCRAAARMLQNGGRFALVYRAEGLAILFAALAEAGLEPKRLRLVQHRADSAPRLALIEAVRQGKPGLRVEPTLVLFQAGGGPTEEYRRIYHM